MEYLSVDGDYWIDKPALILKWCVLENVGDTDFYDSLTHQGTYSLAC